MAGPIMAAVAFVKTVIVTAGAKVGLSAATSLAIAKTVASVAVSKALNKAAKPRSFDAGQQLSFKADTQAGKPIVFGRTATGGNIVFQYPAGPKNKHLNLFTILSGCGPIDAVEKFTANDTQVVFNNANGNVTGGGPYASRMWQKFALGVLGAAALTQPAIPASDSSMAAYWTAAHRLSGFAHVWWDVEYDTGVYPSGLPAPLWVIRGVKGYDPRKDSTYPGGSGAHRVNDQTTWEWTRDPYISGLTWAIGWRENGTLVGGAGVPLSMIDVPAYVEAANVAQANGWHCGGVVTTLDSKWGVLSALLQSGGGKPAQTGALLSCVVSTPRTSLGTITIHDLADGGISIPATKGRRDRINSIIPRYRSEAHNWQVVSAKPVTVAVYVTQDGGLRQNETDYVMCQDAAQAGQLAAYDVVNSREFGPVPISLKPHWMAYKPGDAVTVNLPELGLNNQLVLITDRSPDYQAGTVSLTVQSETTSKHAFALGQTANPPPTPGLTTPDFATVPAPLAGQWAAVGSSLTGGGASVPCITVTGTASDNVFASDVVIEYRLTGTTAWTLWGLNPATATTITIAGLGGLQNYDVAVSYKSIFGVTGSRLILGPVTTPAGSGVASSIDNQGVLATSDFVAFGQPTLLEAPGGAVATVSNFMTALGIASGIVGQGFGATAAEGLIRNSLITIGADGTLTGAGGGSVTIGGLGYTGALNATFGATTGVNLFSSSYGTLSDSSILTALGIASGIAGQGTGATTNVGSLAVLSQIALNTSFILRADGSTVLTESLVITQIGISSGINNQGALATQNSVRPGQFTESDTYTVPLRASANQSGRIDYINDTNSSVSGVSGVPRMVYMCTFHHNNSGVPIQQRVRSGDVEFVLSAYGTVDEYLSIYYQIIYTPTNSVTTGPTWLVDSRETGSGAGGTSCGRVITINIPVDSRIDFFLSVNMSSGSPNSGDRSMRTAGLTVLAGNA